MEINKNQISKAICLENQIINQVRCIKLGMQIILEWYIKRWSIFKRREKNWFLELKERLERLEGAFEFQFYDEKIYYRKELINSEEKLEECILEQKEILENLICTPSGWWYGSKPFGTIQAQVWKYIKCLESIK